MEWGKDSAARGQERERAKRTAGSGPLRGILGLLSLQDRAQGVRGAGAGGTASQGPGTRPRHDMGVTGSAVLGGGQGPTGQANNNLFKRETTGWSRGDARRATGWSRAAATGAPDGVRVPAGGWVWGLGGGGSRQRRDGL